MTEIYYDCRVHGTQQVDQIKIKDVSRSYGPGIEETVYVLRCGCLAINRRRVLNI